MHLNISYETAKQNLSIEPLDLEFDVHLFLQTTTVIG